MWWRHPFYLTLFDTVAGSKVFFMNMFATWLLQEKTSLPQHSILDLELALFVTSEETFTVKATKHGRAKKYIHINQHFRYDLQNTCLYIDECVGMIVKKKVGRFLISTILQIATVCERTILFQQKTHTYTHIFPERTLT